jgi:hypothetical protein
MGRFTKDGDWRKALAIFDCLPLLGLRPDTTISNAAIAACDKGTLAPQLAPSNSCTREVGMHARGFFYRRET